MPTYSLQLLVDPNDLRTLQAMRRTIVLARPVNDPQIPNVVWQSFAPQADTTVTWTDAYGIYAAKTPLIQGAQIIPTHSLSYPAYAASTYIFAPDAAFHGPYYGGGLLGPNQFCVTNDIPPTQGSSLIFGLTQDAIINGFPCQAFPINAQAVPGYEGVVFTGSNKVYIWLQSGVMSGTVITQIPNTMTAVDFGRYTNVQTLKYDATYDTFVPYSHVKRDFVPTLPNVSWSGSFR